MGVADLRDERELRLEPVYVALGFDEDRRQQGFGSVVADVAALLDPLVQPRNGLKLVGEIVAQDLDAPWPMASLLSF